MFVGIETAAQERKGPRSTKRRLFPDVTDGKAESGSVAAECLYQLGLISGGENYFPDSIGPKLFEDDLQNWLFADWKKGLWNRKSQWPQASAHSSDENHSLHK